MDRERVRARCLESRRVADDVYVAGHEYELDAARAARYPAYFTVLTVLTPASGDAGDGDAATKMLPPPPNKMRRGGRAKTTEPNADVLGWPNRAGQTVDLAGNVLAEPEPEPGQEA